MAFRKDELVLLADHLDLEIDGTVKEVADRIKNFISYLPVGAGGHNFSTEPKWEN